MKRLFLAQFAPVAACRRARAFTLIELLTVLALASVLASVTALSFRGTMDGISVSGAAGIAEAEFSLARQTAMSRNLPVEMRIYKHDDGTGDAWRVIALVIPALASGQGSDEWISVGKVLPGHVVMEGSQNFSTILSGASQDPDNASAPWSRMESSTAPRLLRGKSYVGFLFRPDGSTDLPADQPWCLTLKNSLSETRRDGMPAGNFVSIVLDSATGRTLSYQP